MKFSSTILIICLAFSFLRAETGKNSDKSSSKDSKLHIEGSIKLRRRQEANLYLQARMPIEQAISIASAEAKGDIYMAKLDNAGGYLVYVIRMWHQELRNRIIIDAGDGKILHARSSKPKKKYIKINKISLNRAIEQALNRFSGRIIQIELKTRRIPVYEIEIVGDKNIISKLILKASDGQFLRFEDDDE